MTRQEGTSACMKKTLRTDCSVVDDTECALADHLPANTSLPGQ